MRILPEGIRKHIRPVQNKSTVRAAVDAEIEFHLDMLAAELMENGMDGHAARAEARRLFGNPAPYRHECVKLSLRRKRRNEGRDMMGSLLQDLRYGVRTLRNNVGFTFVTVLTLALGIGANTAIFSVIDAVLLKPLPFVHPDRVVQVWDEYPRYPGRDVQLSLPNFADYRDNNVVFERFSAVRPSSFYTDGTTELREVPSLHVSADFFAMTGVGPVLGRTFLPEEDLEGAAPVVLLTHGYWQREFGGTDVLGTTLSFQVWSQQAGGWVPIRLEVVGVLPVAFEVPALKIGTGYRVPVNPELVLPIGLWTWGADRRDFYSLRVLAEMKEGVTPEQASSNLQSIAAGIAALNPETHAGYSAIVAPIAELLRDQYGTALLFLWAAIALVLFIACTNVASMLLGKAVSRERELALRNALGAGRKRIFRQLLTESAILGLSGGALGFLMAYWGAGAFRILTPGDVVRLDQAGIDSRVLLFTTVASILTVLLCGFAPALRGSRTDVVSSLKFGGTGGRAARPRSLSALVVAQVAMSLVLLVGAGLMLRSFVNLVAVDPGFARDNVLLVSVQLPHRQLSKYNNRQMLGQLFLTMRQRLESIPEVTSVAGTQNAPLSGRTSTVNVTIAGRPLPPAEEPMSTDWRNVSAGYFETIGARLISGRTFTNDEFADFLAIEGDPGEAGENLPIPVVIGEGMAQHFWPDEDPLGKQFYWGRVNPEELTAENRPRPLSIVGVVSDLKTTTLDETPPLQWYALGEASVSNLLVRTSSDPTRVSQVVRRELEEIDPNEISVAQIRTMEQVFSGAAAESRFRTLLVTGFASLAAALTALGLFGVVAYSVSRRTHEIGVRMSLGAQSGEISKMVLSHGLRLSALGMTIGLLFSLWLSRYISSLLFEVSPVDPVTLVCVVLLISAIAVAACYLPVRRATRVDPIEVLRQE